jgi:hypothetical protein
MMKVFLSDAEADEPVLAFSIFFSPLPQGRAPLDADLALTVLTLLGSTAFVRAISP